MKTLLCLSLGFILAVQATAQTFGPFDGQSFSTQSIPGSAQTWLNPDNVSGSDNIYSWLDDTGSDNESYTDYLVISNFNFNLPAGASIYGIKVDIERSDPNQVTYDYSIRIVKNGNIGSADRASGLAYPATDDYTSFGSNSDLWGESWAPSDINYSKFGVAISATRKGIGLAGRIDDVKITVYYAVITLPVKLLSFNAQRSGSNVLVKWIASSETDMDQYIVERSADGSNFSAIGSRQSSNQLHADYSYNDLSPLAGNSYYRLAMKEFSGLTTYSRIVQVSFNSSFDAKLYPSQWTLGSNLSIKNPLQESLTIQFYGAEGRLLGIAQTTSGVVNMQQMKLQSGMTFYKVYGKENEVKGSGVLLVN
jgi:hypothetical protein